MLNALFRALTRIYEVFWMLVITALLSAAAVAMWHFYDQERIQALFRKEGIPVTVRIEHTDRSHHDVWDALGNFVYVGFTYQQHPYEARCVSDAGWLSEGDRIRLLYNPQVNAFVQPEHQPASPTRVKSRLIDWTVIRDFKPENKLLGGFILTALALFFVGGGALASLTGWTFIQTIAGLLFTICLGVCAVFSTYDTFRYYQYANQLVANGRTMDVVVTDTDRHTHGRGRNGHWYTYEATFRFNNQERVIAIDEPDYDRLRSGDTRLTVRYDAAVDDFRAVDYDAGLSQLALPLFFWFIFMTVIRPVSTRLKATQPGRNQPGTVSN